MVDLDRRGFLGGAIAAAVAPATAQVSASGAVTYEFTQGQISEIDISEIECAPTLGEWLAEMQRPRWK